MGALGTIVTAAVTATVVIGGVIYVLRRKTPFVNDPNIITKEKFSSSDVLSWIDQIMPSIQTKAECTYSVNILPNSSTNKLLTKPVKNAYAVLLHEKREEKVSYLRQRVYIAKELSSELLSLKNDNVVEIPIQL